MLSMNGWTLAFDGYVNLYYYYYFFFFLSRCYMSLCLFFFLLFFSLSCYVCSTHSVLCKFIARWMCEFICFTRFTIFCAPLFALVIYINNENIFKFCVIVIVVGFVLPLFSLSFSLCLHFLCISHMHSLCKFIAKFCAVLFLVFHFEFPCFVY